MLPDLTDDYAISKYVEGADALPDIWAEKAAAFRDAAPCDLDLGYGPAPRNRFDLFHPTGTPRGLFVFVHGGYWQAFDKSSWSHLAAGALAQGWAVAMPSYTLAPEARITEITRQIAEAITAAAGRVAGPIVLAGHSAGGHLVARMLDPALLPPDVATRLAHVMPISPVADLRPLLQTEMNDVLQLDADEAASESPLLMARRLPAPVTVWVGGDERPVFLDQAGWLAEAWSCVHVVRPGEHHFNVIDALTDPASEMVTRLLIGAPPPTS